MDDDSDFQPLPLPPLRPRVARVDPAHRLPWQARVVDGLARSVPVLVMATLAVATTWLVRQSAQPEAEKLDRAARHVPDYEMHGFAMQRHVGSGLAPSVIEGDEVRHYPDTDTLEIDGVRVRWTDAQGRVTLIRAARAVLADDRSQAVLEGNAVLTRLPLNANEERMEFRGERLLLDNAAQRVRADQPVTLSQGRDVFDAAGLDYEHASGRLELRGGVHGVLPDRGKRP